MNLYALDCDDTLEVSAGPLPLAVLARLQEQGHVVVIVSPSPACASLDYPRVLPGERIANLLKAKELYTGYTAYIYVSDNNGDDVRAKEAGFVYIHPRDFAACALCRLENKTKIFYEEQEFIVLLCQNCKVPMVVWRAHTEPPNPAIDRMGLKARDLFPERVPDFNRRTIKDHFHFHLRES